MVHSRIQFNLNPPDRWGRRSDSQRRDTAKKHLVRSRLLCLLKARLVRFTLCLYSVLLLCVSFQLRNVSLTRIPVNCLYFRLVRSLSLNCSPRNPEEHCLYRHQTCSAFLVATGTGQHCPPIPSKATACQRSHGGNCQKLESQKHAVGIHVVT